MNQMPKLIRWNVPFSRAFYPGVSATFETPTHLSQGKVKVTVSLSDGTLFRVESTSVIAFTCLDESCAPKRWFSTVETEQREISAYLCVESPWIESYEGCQYDANGDPIPLNHYLIYGGDNIVEFVCQHEPVVSQLPNWK
jgi:hypothetical protein